MIAATAFGPKMIPGPEEYNVIVDFINVMQNAQILRKGADKINSYIVSMMTSAIEGGLKEPHKRSPNRTPNIMRNQMYSAYALGAFAILAKVIKHKKNL